jgi:hypothetical protein
VTAAALGCFGAGLAVAGTATSMTALILGRALQGSGSALFVVSTVLVGRVYAPEQRPRVFTWMSAAWIVPALVGPAIAGTLADTVGWRWVFLGLLPMVVPVGVLLLLAMRPYDRRHVRPDAHESGREADADAGPAPRRLGLAVVAAIGVAAVQQGALGLRPAEGGSPGAPDPRLGLLVGAAGLALLAWAVPRLLPAGTLRLARGVPSVVAARGLLGASFFGAEAFLPLMLVEDRGLSAAVAGSSLTLGALGWFAGSWVQGRPGLTTPRPRLVGIGGLLIAVSSAGAAIVAGVAAVPWPVALVAWGVGAAGMGVAVASFSVLMLDQTPPAKRGVTSAALQLAEPLAATVTVALAGAVYAAGRAAGSGGESAAFAAIFTGTTALALVVAAVSPRVQAET